jgi:hypothetical protein
MQSQTHGKRLVIICSYFLKEALLKTILNFAHIAGGKYANKNSYGVSRRAPLDRVALPCVWM